MDVASSEFLMEDGRYDLVCTVYYLLYLHIHNLLLVHEVYMYALSMCGDYLLL
jgi:hypothetical protein